MWLLFLLEAQLDSFFLDQDFCNSQWTASFISLFIGQPVKGVLLTSEKRTHSNGVVLLAFLLDDTTQGIGLLV